ncbi:hypothetical protein EWE75_18685 [Sphingomonas populi]|uniref:Uncharacterized protein n=1 Tax=Sphingomonas populi TaxID=2484750 RepID=A0A4Q6XW86_9SPHN|nr:DUF6771 family protein [Sphingomonas populi]RZF61219.1 hypothetical protein EWE75_18685 [Sphingomonas populi]
MPFTIGLSYGSCFVLKQDMAQRLTPDPALLEHAIAALSESPGWARVGLTFGNERLREEAVATLAGAVVERLVNPPPVNDPDQLHLF